MRNSVLGTFRKRLPRRRYSGFDTQMKEPWRCRHNILCTQGKKPRQCHVLHIIDLRTQGKESRRCKHTVPSTEKNSHGDAGITSLSLEKNVTMVQAQRPHKRVTKIQIKCPWRSKNHGNGGTVYLTQREKIHEDAGTVSSIHREKSHDDARTVSAEKTGILFLNCGRQNEEKIVTNHVPVIVHYVNFH